MMFNKGTVLGGILCPDGKHRTVYVSGEADSFYSAPAYVHKGGRKVIGYVTTEGDDIVFRSDLQHKGCLEFPEQYLQPGVIVEMMVGETVYKRGRIAHWTWDDRPYWLGPARWLIVVSWEYHNPEAYGVVGGDVYDQRSTDELLFGVLSGNYRLPHEFGMPIGIGPK